MRLFAFISTPIVVLLMICCGCQPRAFTDETDRAYNFSALLRDRCFRTKTETLLTSPTENFYILSPRGSESTDLSEKLLGNANLDEAAGSSCQAIRVHLNPGVEIRPIRVLIDNAGNWHVEAVITNGQMKGLSVDAIEFFLPEWSTTPYDNNANAFIIGSRIEPCGNSAAK